MKQSTIASPDILVVNNNPLEDLPEQILFCHENKNKYRSTCTTRGPRLRHPQKFFQGGSSEVSFIYWINQNLTAAITILLRGLNQKLKRSCSKNVACRRHVKQTDAIQVYCGWESEGVAPTRWAIFAIT